MDLSITVLQRLQHQGSTTTSHRPPVLPPPSCAGFASALCSCAEEQRLWANSHGGRWQDWCRRSIALSPAVGSTGLQLWRIASVNGSRLVPGTVVTLQNTARAACGGYIATATAQCGYERAWLSSERPAMASARWVLRAGPKPATFMLESQAKAAKGCPQRWLGAPRRCGTGSLGLYAATDSNAAVVWLVLPA